MQEKEERGMSTTFQDNIDLIAILILCLFGRRGVGYFRIIGKKVKSVVKYSMFNGIKKRY